MLIAHRLRVFENIVIWGIFVFRRDEVRETEENYMMRNSIICAVHQKLLG
jgi:hypothetical protein